MGARYAFEGIQKDGWYAQGDLSTSSAEASIKSSITDDTLTASSSAAGIVAGGGYAWYWTSFYQRLGLTVVLGSNSTDVKVRNSNGNEEKVTVRSSPGAGIVYNIGWRF